MKNSTPLKSLLLGSALALSALTGSTAHAAIALPTASISLQPSATTVSTGATFSIDIRIADLGSDAVGAWDGSLLFDSPLVSLLGASLGDQLNLAGLGSYQAISPGLSRVDLLEASYDTPAQLLDEQADSFILATLNFTVLSAGELAFAFNGHFSDASGESELALLNDSASLHISAVPLPAALWLLLSGCGVLLTQARRRSPR